MRQLVGNLQYILISRCNKIKQLEVDCTSLFLPPHSTFHRSKKMQLRILLCALVALTACATPIVAPNPKSVKLIPKTDNEENLRENFDVIRSRRAAKDTWEDAADGSRMEDFQTVFKMLEKFVNNSERLTKVKNMSGMMSEMVKLIRRFLELMENHMNDSNNVNHSSES